MVIAGISTVGLFPGDRDLDEGDTQRWLRWSPWLLFGCLGALFAELILPLPAILGTALLVGMAVAYVAGQVWFMTHGRPMTDAVVAEKLAKTGMTMDLAIVSAKPGFFGKAARLVIVGAACAFSALIIGGMLSMLHGASEPRGRARWTSLPVHYCTDTSLNGYMADDQFIESAALAFERWGVPAVHDGACDSFVQRADGVSAIGWRPSFGDPEGATYSAGTCRYFCNADERRAILESDVYLKPFSEEEYATRECFDALMLHEVGHFLGLKHNDGYGVMGDGDYCSSEFSSEDLAALFERYGEDARPQYATLTGRE